MYQKIEYLFAKIHRYSRNLTHITVINCPDSTFKRCHYNKSYQPQLLQQGIKISQSDIFMTMRIQHTVPFFI